MGWMHRNEARINPHLPAPMPRMHWQIEADGWLMLGFEYVEGRHPDLSPDSPDLPVVAATLNAMAAALTPCPIPKVQAATVRWADRVACVRRPGDAAAGSRPVILCGPSPRRSVMSGQRSVCIPHNNSPHCCRSPLTAMRAKG